MGFASGLFSATVCRKAFPTRTSVWTSGWPATFLRINEASSCLVRQRQRISKWKNRGEIAPTLRTEASCKQQARALLLFSAVFVVLPGAGAAHYQDPVQQIKE